MECLQHERVRIFQNKTSIERQSFMRIFGTGERVVSANKSRSLPAEFDSQYSLYHDD